MSYSSKNTVDCHGGFIKTTRAKNKDRVTLWVEGRDSDGRSVSGVSMDELQLDKLIRRLTNLRQSMRRTVWCRKLETCLMQDGHSGMCGDGGRS